MNIPTWDIPGMETMKIQRIKIIKGIISGSKLFLSGIQAKT